MHQYALVVGFLGLALGFGSGPARAESPSNLVQDDVIQVNMSGFGVGNLTYSLAVLDDTAGAMQKVRLYEVHHQGDPEWDRVLPVDQLKTSTPPALMSSSGQDTIWVELDPSFDPAAGGPATVRYRSSPLNHRTNDLATKLIKDKFGKWEAIDVQQKNGVDSSFSFRQLDVTVTLTSIKLQPVQ